MILLFWMLKTQGEVNIGARRVLRGGSFNDPSTVVRSADRYLNRPDLRSYDGGFRPSELTTEVFYAFTFPPQAGRV